MRVLITGTSRGLGAAIARAFARHHGPDAQIALLGRSGAAPSHRSLEGTLRETQRDVEAHGALGVPFEVDLRDGEQLARTLKDVLHAFDGLDVLINNASVLRPERTLPAKRMDLVHAVNARATLLCLQECREALEASPRGGSIVTIAPPVRLGRLEWIARSPAYTLSKYQMSLATLAAASARVRANCLWPKRTVATAATKMLEERGIVPGAHSKGRRADAVAEAVHLLATRSTLNAATVLDEDLVTFDHGHDAPLDAYVSEDDWRGVGL
jgi:citronellol/citronellal dehydrogenase